MIVFGKIHQRLFFKWRFVAGRKVSIWKALARFSQQESETHPPTHPPPVSFSLFRWPYDWKEHLETKVMKWTTEDDKYAYAGKGELFFSRGTSIVKVPGDVPPARVYFFKLSSLAKGIRFANFSPFTLGKGMLFGNFSRFWSGQGMLFGNFRQRNVKVR